MKASKGRHDVIVIGGGAAGMMAAGVAASRGKRVLLLEKNKKLGEKLRISGGGRCNILNAEDDLKRLLPHFGEAEQPLYSAFSQFGVRDAIAFFERLGLPIVVQVGKRAFPKSEQAADVVKALEKYLAESKVEVLRGRHITAVRKRGGKIETVNAGSEEFAADSYIFATGGYSHPETGSTGEGFAWLSGLGHTTKEPTPTIVPLKASDAWVADVSGTSIPDMKISFSVNGKRAFSARGPLLFTHFGISGPTVLNAAGKVGDLLYEGSVSASIDTRPDTDLGILDRELRALFDENKNKDLKNVFKAAAPAGMTPTLLSLVPAIDPDKKVHSITKEERRMLVDLLKGIPLSITGLMGFEKAVVADGGIPLSEVDLKTMRSKKQENVYIVGDLLHITRPSGGYSLQLCWTTGYIAGMNA